MPDGYRKTLNGGNIPAVVTKCDVSGDGCKGNAKNAELPSVLQVRQSDFIQTTNGRCRAKLTPQTFICSVI